MFKYRLSHSDKHLLLAPMTVKYMHSHTHKHVFLALLAPWMIVWVSHTSVAHIACSNEVKTGEYICINHVLVWRPLHHHVQCHTLTVQVGSILEVVVHQTSMVLSYPDLVYNTSGSRTSRFITTLTRGWIKWTSSHTHLITFLSSSHNMHMLWRHVLTHVYDMCMYLCKQLHTLFGPYQLLVATTGSYTRTSWY